MYYEHCSWQRDQTLKYIMMECGLLDCATEEEIDRVGKYISSHMCCDINIQNLAEMIASYSKPACNMVDFIAWIMAKLSNHCVSRFYYFRRCEEEEQ